VVSAMVLEIADHATCDIGVNLPVRSVVVASQGSWGPEGRTEYITGSTLVNAIGRAGRATKETEGIVVLARQAAFNLADFDRLDPPPEDLQATSTLATDRALGVLDEYERRVREREGAIFEGGDQRALAFLSFVWFFLSELEREQIPLDVDSVQSLLESTLAWQQIPADQRSTFRRMAVAGTRAYARSNPESRRRWARAGTSLRTAIALESIAEAVALIDYDPEVDAPDDLIVRIFAGGRLESLLDLPEAPTIRAFTARGGRRSQIPVPIPELVGSWMQGTSLSDMAHRFLGVVQDAEYRFEQLGDLISGLCEAYLPWVLAVIIEWANSRRTESDPPGTPLPSELPA
jgi:hypothetical protein